MPELCFQSYQVGWNGTARVKIYTTFRPRICSHLYIITLVPENSQVSAHTWRVSCVEITTFVLSDA
jgi:hypothetical protein